MPDRLESAILRLYPQAAKILAIQSYRPGYLLYPAHVTLETTTGEQVICVAEASTDVAKINYTAAIMRALRSAQLSVPAVIGGPVLIQDEREALALILVSEMPGQPLPWIALNDLALANRTCQLVHEAVDRLHGVTAALLAHPIAARIPSFTLASELQMIRANGGPWFDVPLFAEAFALVEATHAQVSIPLVFSNGDYNPLNFLVDNDELVGWIDFEHACFEDPYIGFAKFLLWANDDSGWGAGAKAGLVERYLYKHNVAPADFLVRLLLRGLRHVQEASVAEPPVYMLGVIDDAVQRLKGSDWARSGGLLAV
jgi:Ser/Thr protein kinase RdoA (MazF antagonist)